MPVAAKIDPRYGERFRYPKWTRTVTVVDEPRLFPRVFPELKKEDHLRLAEEYAKASGAARVAWGEAVDRAVRRHGDGDGRLISGIYRQHFPEATKERLREKARAMGDFSSMSQAHWKAAGKRTPWQASYLRALAHPAGT